MGCLGGNSAAKQQNKQIEATYKYDKQLYDFNWATQDDVAASLADNDPNDPETLKNDLTLGKQWTEYDHALDILDTKKENDLANKKYQDDTAKQAHDFQVSIQDYEFKKQQEAYLKSEDTYGKQLGFNEVEYRLALENEQMVLDEEFLGVAFDNASLIQDLYETTGEAGYEDAFIRLGLKDAQGQAGYQTTQQLTNLEKTVSDSEFSKADIELDLINKSGTSKFNKALIAQDVLTKEGTSRYDKLGIDLDIKNVESNAEFQNNLLRRELSDAKAQSAHQKTEDTVKALRAAGQAQVGQAGRSQGKVIQSVFAELGRQQAYQVESIVRGQAAAEARAKQNKITALNTTSKARIAKNKIDMNSLDTLAKADLQTKEINRDLKMSDQKGELNLDKIRKEVLDASNVTNLGVKEIQRSLENTQTKAGFDLNKGDWGLANVGSRFKQNQGILKAQLDSAVRASVMTQKDYTLAKLAADFQADANRMAKPERPPSIPAPIPLPLTKYEDPLAPTPPPEPIKGAKADTNSAINAASSIVGGIAAGAGTAAGLGAMGMGAAAAGPIGWAVGIGTALFG